MDQFLDLPAFFQMYAEAAGKILLSAFLGGLFGLEREWRGREAGLRTNMMISIASCLFTYLGMEAFPFGEGIMRDPARVAAQIVSGVGFLGAGALLHHRNTVRGLTTAAAIWLVAAVGMAVGAGAYFSAIFTTFVALFVLVLLLPLSHRLEARARARYDLRQVTRDLNARVDEAEEDRNYWLDEETD